MIVFDAHECACPHPAEAHDDGFGCTRHGCDCLAGWSLAVPSRAEAEAGQ